MQPFVTPWTVNLPGSSVRGILQARTLEWVACPPPGESSRPRDQTHVPYISCIGRQVLYHQHLLGNPALSLAPIKSLFLKSIHLEKRNTRLPYPSSFLLAILSSTWLSSLAPWLPTALRMPRVLGMLHCRCREVTQPQGPEGD